MAVRTARYSLPLMPAVAPDTVRVAVEAAGGFGWERYLGHKGIFIGMHGFGASAPAKDLYKHFGITADHIVEAVTRKFKL